MSSCGFCQGQPVMSAQTWQDGKRRASLPCPRCGKTVLGEWVQVGRAQYRVTPGNLTGGFRWQVQSPSGQSAGWAEVRGDAESQAAAAAGRVA